MLANIENLFVRDSSRNRSHVALGRFPLFQAYLVLVEKLQSYMDRFGLEIASIFSPLWKSDCVHIRSPLSIWLQAYLVPWVTVIASIIGLCYENYCKHNWSSPIEIETYFGNILKKINPFQIVFKVGSSSTTIVWSWSWSCSVSSFCTKSYCEDKSSVIGDVPPDIKT